MMIRKMLEDAEHQLLHPLAAFSDESKGRSQDEAPCSIRPAFQHDRDKILHCKAFRRLLHKTQVFLSPQGDHYRTRMTHTLEVSQIARTLARALRLNEHLTEAIGLGHDLGHTPFGHAGETVLNELMPGGFKHVAQSVRVVEVLERDGSGLNLTTETIDGIARHSKGKGKILNGATIPMTLEGQLVRLSDIVAYVNHDLDDALRGGLLELEDIPEDLLSTLGHTHSKRIEMTVEDVLKSTDLDNEGRIQLSAEREEALQNMRSFLYERVYENPVVYGEFTKCHKILEDIFVVLEQQPEVFERLKGKKAFAEKGRHQRAVCDFLAGMTDRFTIRLYEELFVPKPWPIGNQ